MVPWTREQRRIRRAVVLGAPGGGKSFLTDATGRELAREALDQLLEQQTPIDDLPIPVHVQLAELAARKRPPDPADAVVELLRMRHGPSPRFEAWLRAKLPTEQCWLILDALDQIEEANRQHLRRRLEAMGSQGWRSRVTLTCRTVNYDRAWIPWSTLTEYELAPFNRREIRQFVGQWFGEGNEHGAKLRDALAANFQLSHACRNPLLTTLTCLAHEEAPVAEQTRRVDLYARVLRGLARRAWKEDPLDPNDPHIDDLIALLEPVAWTLFQKRPESNLFTNSEVIDALGAVPNLPLPLVLRRQLDQGALHPSALAHAPTLLRDELRECGILAGAGLSRDGEAQFSSLHRTFLEYLAARHLCAEAEHLRDNAPVLHDKLLEWIDLKAWDPAYREVVVLLLGLLADPAALLNRLADRDGDDEFRHRLAVAALGVAEVAADTPGRDEVAAEAVSVWWSALRSCTTHAFYHLEAALPAAWEADRGGRSVQQVCQWLVEDLSEIDEMGTPQPAHRALESVGELVWADARARHALLDAMHHPDYSVRMGAVRALGEIGELVWADLDARDALLRALGDDRDLVRNYAARALGEIGEVVWADEDARKALLEALLHDRDAFELGSMKPYTRQHAAEALGRMGESVWSDERARRALLEALRDTDPGVSVAAARALCSIGDLVWQDERVRSALLAALLDSRPVYVSPVGADVARALGAIGEAVWADERARMQLVRALRGRSALMRVHAAQALGAIGKAVWGDERAKAALLAAASDEEAYRNISVRSRAIDALGEIGQAAWADQRVRGVLVEALSDPDEFVRMRAAMSLGQIGEVVLRDRRAREALARALENSERQSEHVAEALGRMGRVAWVDERMRRAVVGAARDAGSSWRAWHVLRSMGRIGELVWEDREARAAILGAFGSGDTSVRRAAAEALEGIGDPIWADECARHTLAGAMQDRDAHVRYHALRALRKIHAPIWEDGKIRDLLLGALCSGPHWVTVVAADTVRAWWGQGIRLLRTSAGLEPHTVEELSWRSRRRPR